MSDNVSSLTAPAVCHPGGEGGRSAGPTAGTHPIVALTSGTDCRHATRPRCCAAVATGGTPGDRRSAPRCSAGPATVGGEPGRPSGQIRKVVPSGIVSSRRWPRRRARRNARGLRGLLAEGGEERLGKRGGGSGRREAGDELFGAQGAGIDMDGCGVGCGLPAWDRAEPGRPCSPRSQPAGRCSSVPASCWGVGKGKAPAVTRTPRALCPGPVMASAK